MTYQSTRRPDPAMTSPRQVEYSAFAKVTMALREASSEGTPFATLAQAMHENRRLWDIVALECANDDNALPVDLRAGLISLAEFTRRHTSIVLKADATADPLIDINLAVMRGLRASSAVAMEHA